MSNYIKFIKANEFLNQSKEVQKVFLDWWQPSEGDIYCNLYNNQQDNVLVIQSCQLEVFKSFKENIKLFGIPLFTEGQLREFIEDNGYSKVILELTNLYYKRKTNNYCKTYGCRQDNILLIYWKIACQIAYNIVEKDREDKTNRRDKNE